MYSFNKWLELKGLKVRGNIYLGANRIMKNKKIITYTDKQMIMLINNYFEELGHQKSIEDIMNPLTNRKKGRINYKKIKADLINQLGNMDVLCKLIE